MTKQSEKILETISRPQYKPLKVAELAYLMEVPPNRRHLFENEIEDMAGCGLVFLSGKGKVCSVASQGMVTGAFTGSPQGYGFVAADADGGEGDIFIPARSVGCAIHGDRVLCKIVPESGRYAGSKASGQYGIDSGRQNEGEIIRVISRETKSLVGCFTAAGGGRGSGRVIPKDKRFCPVEIPPGFAKGAVDGHMVVCRLDREGRGGPFRERLSGRVTEIIGHKNDPGVDVLSIVRQYEVPWRFPKDAQAEARRAPAFVTGEGSAQREDLRGSDIVTIDGDDTKDVDDAISVGTDGAGNFLLGVHIADVCHYVREGSAMDREARRRGTSVYLADRVIPMLPRELSDGICSLAENEDRLALSCVMTVDRAGRVTDHRIFHSVIRVKRKLTYTEANAIICGEGGAKDRHYGTLSKLDSLREILSGKRSARGSVDFFIPEAKITVDETGFPTDIRAYEKNRATGVIEECMILCNETVAEHFFWIGAPFIYRTHEAPDPDKMRLLENIADNFGLGRGRVKPGDPNYLRELIGRAGTVNPVIISMLALRSMKQARYAESNAGHYGLASGCYCHFTSPIRRYPDLMIHRIIKAQITGSSDTEPYRQGLPELCRACSAAERTAEELERQVEGLKKAQYMQGFVGKKFDGYVSGVTKRGAYVALPNTVEGFIPLKDLRDDYYIFDENRMELSGARGGNAFRLGDRVRVMVTGADPEERLVNFAYVSRQ